MARRNSILIKYVFSYDSSTAIPIYLQNLIKALHTLPDNRKPTVYLFYTEDAPVNDVISIQYPYIKMIPAGYWGPFWQRAINKFISVFFQGNYIFFHGVSKYKIDCIFPHFGPIDKALQKQTVAWITDFQPHYYPAFFPEDDINRILRNLTAVSLSSVKLVLSSNSAYDDYKKFYPSHKNKVILLRFVSILPEVKNENWSFIKDKFSINKPYFIISNQFWPHKNHANVIEAVNILKKNYKDELPFEILITGKPFSHRNPTIFEELTSKLEEYNLTGTIRFLGFLEREEQIQLIRNADAVIQPSFFEGWSTLVEECKALNKFIILSDLPVHREQIDRNVSFFNPDSAEELATKIQEFLHFRPEIVPFKYADNIKKYAEDILKLF